MQAFTCSQGATALQAFQVNPELLNHMVLLVYSLQVQGNLMHQVCQVSWEHLVIQISTFGI